jgi:hypothetical protein
VLWWPLLVTALALAVSVVSARRRAD